MKLNRILPFVAVLAAFIASAPLVSAQDHKGHTQASAPTKTNATPEAREMTNAEVRKIDKSTKKITLRHEPIKSLDMPSMTMVFQVADAALLDKVQVGDKVKFAAKQEGSTYVVTDLVADK